MYMKCMQMQLRLHGKTKENIDVAITMNNLALVKGKQGELSASTSGEIRVLGFIH